MINQSQLFRLLLILSFLLFVTPQCQDQYISSVRQLQIQNSEFQINCSSGIDGKQWITILSHKSNTLDFSQFQWDDFAHHGVGSFSGDFVQALDQIHLLSQTKDLELLVQLSNAGSSRWVLYQKFSIASESEQYALSVSGYDPTSTAQDALTPHNGMMWSSPDRDNDEMQNWHCANELQTSFWYQSCYNVNPLGLQGDNGDLGMVWQTDQERLVLDSITFKVREKLCTNGNGLECRKCKEGAYLCTSDKGYTSCCLKPITTCEAANQSGKYDITLGDRITTVMCDMKTDGGGWAELLARRDGSVNDFYLYVFDRYASEGIGDPGQDNIVALDYWNLITNSSRQQLLIEMTYRSQYYWSMYHSFTVANKSESYTLIIDEYDNQSTGGRSLDSSNGMKFSTLDVDNDISQSINCAIAFRRPFWNSKCGFVGPLSKYGVTKSGQGVYWQGVTGCCSSLDTIFFKSRTKRCTLQVDSYCSECETGYQLVTDQVSGRYICSPVCNQDGCTQCHSLNPRVCVGDCNPGYFYVEGTRSCNSNIALNLECASHCATCSVFDVCESCSNNGVVYEGGCFSECPATFYPDPTRNCLKCPQENCSKCSDSQCLQCSKPYFLHETECMQTCPDGYYGDQDQNQCLPCAEQCHTCTGPSTKECQSCNSALNYVIKAPSSCVCPSRHFPAPDKSCQECHSRCLLCYGPTEAQCLECLPQFWKKDKQCYRCEDTPGLVTETTEVCREICGDGLDLGYNECEDGNLEDGDGCSSACKLEPNNACKSETPTGPFLCWETIPPIMSGAQLSSDYILTISLSEPVLSMITINEDDFIVSTQGPRELKFTFTKLQPQGMELFDEIKLKIIPEQDIAFVDEFQISVKLYNFTKIKDINNNQLVASQILLKMPQYSASKPEVFLSQDTSYLADILYLCFSPQKSPGILSNSLLFLILSGLGGGVLWDLVFHIQLLNFIPLVNIPLPSNLLKVYTVFSGTNLDLQAIEGALSTSTVKSNYVQISSLNQRYSAYRFKNSNFIINCCFILLVINIQILALPVLYLFKKLARCFSWQACHNLISQNCLRKVIRYYWFNLIIRMSLLCYVQLLFSATLNILKVSASAKNQISFSTATEIFSSVLSILFIIPLILFPSFVICILRKPENMIVSVKFMNKFGVLTKGLQIHKKQWAAKHYYSWFVIRRLLFILTLLLLRFSIRLQLIILIVLSLFTITFIIRVKPFLENAINTLLILHQIVMAAVLLIFVGFSLQDDPNNSYFQIGGWICIFLPLFSIVTSSLVNIVQNFKKCKQSSPKIDPIIQPDLQCKTKADLLDDHTPRVPPPLEKKSSMNWEIMVNSTPTSNKHVHSFSKFDNEEFKLEQDQEPSSERNFFERQQTIRSHASTSALHYRSAPAKKFSQSDIHSKFKNLTLFDGPEGVDTPSNRSDCDNVSRLSSRKFHPDFKESNISLSVPSFYPSPKQSVRQVVAEKRKRLVHSYSFKEKTIPEQDFEPAPKIKLSSRNIEEDQGYHRKIASFWERAKKDNNVSSFKRAKRAFE